MFTLLCLPSLTVAEETQYNIDWRGIPIGEAVFRVENGGDRYRIAFEVQSIGFLNLVFPFRSKGHSAGLIREGKLLPTTHSAVSSVRDEPRSWTVGFGLDGTVTNRFVQEMDERDPVPETLQRAPDPLALAFDTLNKVEPGSAVSGRSFDDRRALELDMRCGDVDKDRDELTCLIDGELLAGRSKRWRDEHEDDPPERKPVEVKLARNIQGKGWWPIELAVESRFGPVRATLAAR